MPLLLTPPVGLPAGFTPDLIADAIAASGYPLQSLVARTLSKWFHVDEEWPFLDRQGPLRTLDILARRPLWDFGSAAWDGALVRPRLVALVECKASRSPWVFFESVSLPRLANFPLFAGLRSSEMTIQIPDAGGQFLVTPMQVLGLDDHPFVMEAPAVATLFTKVVRKGAAAELTGADAFVSVVEPLISAMAYYETSVSPPPTFLVFECDLTIGVFVTDAPLVIAAVRDRPAEASDLRIAPWIRVIRHTSLQGAHPWENVRHWAIDCVTVDFLNEYVTSHLLPFAKRIARRVRLRDTVLATGHGVLHKRARALFASQWIRPDPDHLPEHLDEEHAHQPVLVRRGDLGF